MILNQIFNEGLQSDLGQEPSAVASAITRRIIMQRTDLLSKYGPVLVTQAIDEVADYVGDVDEIGSSDVSGWIKQVERMLADNPPEAFGEGVAQGLDNMEIGQQMANDGITYSPEKENELINLMSQYMKKAGMSSKAIRYHLSYDEDYIPDQLRYLPKQGMSEDSQRVDSLVTDALKIMRGSELSDAVAAIKTVLGDREYNGRRGFYSFYVRQLVDMYSQQGVTEGKGPLGQGDLGLALKSLAGGWSGWHKEDDLSTPEVDHYEYDDGEGNYYGRGTIEHNLKTGEIKVEYHDSENDVDVDDTFHSVGDAMKAIRGQWGQSHGGKAPNFDRLGQRKQHGADDLRKTDRTGRKGTLAGGPSNELKRSIQWAKGKHGPQGVLPEAGPYGSNNPDTMSPGNYDRYQQDQMDQGKRDFKRGEHEAEWEQEKAYSDKLAARDAGTWYIRLNGKIMKDKQGNPYSFQGKAAANKAALTMRAKLFNQDKEFMLTTNLADT